MNIRKGGTHCVVFPDPVSPTMTITWFSLKIFMNSSIWVYTGSFLRASRIFLYCAVWGFLVNGFTLDS